MDNLLNLTSESWAFFTINWSASMTSIKLSDLMEADSCLRQRKRIDEGQDERMKVLIFPSTL